MTEIRGMIQSASALTGTLSNQGSITGDIAGLRGLKGDKGDPGEKGDTGDTGATGNGISSAILNSDYTLTLNFTDGTSYTTTAIRGEKGDTGDTGLKGDTGDTGNGIASIAKTGTQGLVDTYTITFTDGTTSTFTVTNGQNGAGSVADVWQNGVSVLDDDVAKVTVPTKTSDLTNDSGYITGYTETDPTVPSWAKQTNKPSYAYSEISNTPQLAVVATSGNYEDLSNLPTIPTVPTNVSDFTNDANYQNATQVATAVNEAKVVVVEVPSFSSLPQTVTDSRITSDHVVVYCEYGTPSAMTSRPTYTTSDGSITISGSMSGSTTLTLTLAVKQ